MNNKRGQFSIVNFGVFIIVFLITAAFFPVISSFIGLVTSNSDVPESGKTLFGLIPAFIAATLIASLFAYASSRKE
ncbi:MAG: hypothetical protein WC766_06265 [Patescibacteria group bacterium]|jgi:hypothetical protein